MEEPTDKSGDLLKRLLSEGRSTANYLRKYERTAKDLLTEKDLERICAYLRNPISSGLWLFKGKWHRIKGLTHELIEEYKNLEESSGKTDDKKHFHDIQKDLSETATTMTFALTLFDYITHLPKSRKESQDFHVLHPSLRDDYRLIERLDIQRISRKYAKELECFRNRIFLEESCPRLGYNEFSYTKYGPILLKERGELGYNESEQQNWDFIFIALDSEPLEGLAEFFNGIGKISDYSVTPLYSPEEEVFEPYFSFLELASDIIFRKTKILTLIEQSISIYNGRNYPYCISTIGLILEEQLTQIYETLFRDRCPQGSTIGELLDLIERRVKNTVQHDDHKKTIDVNSIYERINSSLVQNASSPATNEDLLKIIRDVLTFVKENDKQILSRLASPQKSEAVSIFPNELRDGMNELIMYRNAISHRSRIPIGSFEALKSIHHISSLIMWWNEEMKSVNWKHSPELIIKDMIIRNNPQVAGQIS